MEQPRSLQPPQVNISHLSKQASHSNSITPLHFSRSYQNCLWMNSACLSCLWNLRGVAAIKPRLLPSPAGLLVCTECSLHQSCLVLSQATLSNKIQSQGHSFPPHPFQIFLITSFETASSLKSHLSAKFGIGVLCWSHSWSLPNTFSEFPQPMGIPCGERQLQREQVGHTWDTCQAWHCLLPMKQIFGKSSGKTSQRTGGWKSMGGGNLWGVLTGR